MELEDEDNLISDSFDQSIYSYKESLYKTVPLQKGAGGGMILRIRNFVWKMRFLLDLNGAF